MRNNLTIIITFAQYVYFLLLTSGKSHLLRSYTRTSFEYSVLLVQYITTSNTLRTNVPIISLLSAVIHRCSKCCSRNLHISASTWPRARINHNDLLRTTKVVPLPRSLRHKPVVSNLIYISRISIITRYCSLLRLIDKWNSTPQQSSILI